MPLTNPFEKQSYISFETYRKNGQPVRTPVWFSQDETLKHLYIWTEINSGKVKRIRNNSSVKLAPSNSRGTPKGDYFPASAMVAEQDSPDHKVGVKLINKKYGVTKKVFDLFLGSNKPHCIIKLDLE